MKPVFLALLMFISLSGFAQTVESEALAGSRKFQEELDADYRNKDKSPLEPAALETFKGHDFFPLDLAYRFNATLTVTAQEPVFKMPTTTARLADYRKYGEVEFTFKGKPYKLNVYQSPDLMKKPGYEDYLFLPFTDLTTGTHTYVGGRYLDLRIPEAGNQIVLDFNRAYNPYCAYSPRYSCPKVPAENHLDMEVMAGIKFSK